MEVKVDLNTGDIEGYARQKIMASATEFILTQLTPEILREYIGKFFQEKFESYWTYDNRRLVADAMTKIVQDLMTTPEYQERIRVLAKEGLDRWLGLLPSLVDRQLARALPKTIVDAIKIADFEQNRG